MRPVLSLAALLLTAVLAWPVRTQAPAPDLLLVNGTVITVDPRDTVAEALAIRGGKIVAVGTTGDISRLAGPNTGVVDLEGRGDARADRYAPARRAFLRASDLDPVSPDHPVWLTHTTGHYGVGNSLALKLAELTKDTPDPPAGTIERDANGQPTGLLKETATGLVTRAMGGRGGAGRGRGGDPAVGLAATFANFNREGMTAVKDPGVNAARFDTYRQMLDDGTLTVRVAALWRGGSTMESLEGTIQRMASCSRAPETYGDGRLVSAGVKLYLDGSGGARTGWMHRDWNIESTKTEAGNSGCPTTEPAVYKQLRAPGRG